MMKKLMTITMILICGQGFTQSDLDTFDKKDVIEKLDRSDLDMKTNEKVKLDDSILKFEIPKMELDVPIKQKPSVKKIAVIAKKAQPETNPTVAKPTVSSEKKEVVEVKEVTKNQSYNEIAKEAKANNQKLKVVFAKRPILISQFKKNDKIVMTNDKTFVYRMLSPNIIQYKYFGKMPYASKGLRKNDENSYYVVDKKLLIADSKITKNAPIKPTQVIQPVAKPVAKPIAEKQTSSVVTTDTSSDIQEKRKVIEEKYNNGKNIKKSIQLKNLHRNDEIYIVGDIQFVIRDSTSGNKKYWLTEKLDVNNTSVEEFGNNKYRIIRFYKE